MNRSTWPSTANTSLRLPADKKTTAPSHPDTTINTTAPTMRPMRVRHNSPVRCPIGRADRTASRPPSMFSAAEYVFR